MGWGPPHLHLHHQPQGSPSRFRLPALGKPCHTETINRQVDMIKAAAVTFCAGILAGLINANAANSQSLCQRGSTGFIQAGGKTICIGGSPGLPESPRQRPSAATSNRPKVDTNAKGYNRDLDSPLNEASLRFREGRTESACGFASFAISETNSSGASAEQSLQLKDYAKRCNLRY